MTLTLTPHTMKAMMFHQPGVVRYESVLKPTPDPGEIIVKIGTALTCGTDLKCFKRGHPVLLKNFPSPFGHEFSGTVVAIGEGVTQFQPGERVVAANSAPCFACFYCQKAQYNLCEHLDLLNGAYADFMKVPAQIVAVNTHKIPDSLPFELAAFTEPLAVSLRGIEHCRIKPGDQVAVMGLGPIGLLMVRLAVMQGAVVTAYARNPLKRSLAETFGGAHTVIDLSQYPDFFENPTDCLPKALENRGFDVVIEAIGLPESWQAAIQLVRKGGLVNWFGGCASGTQVQLDTRRIHYDEITLISLFHHTPAHVKQAVDLLSSGELDPSPLISERFEMSQLLEAFQLLETGKAIKVALTPESH